MIKRTLASGVSALTLAVVSTPAVAETYPANHCEVFIDKVAVGSRGQSYHGSMHFELEVKVLKERFTEDVVGVVVSQVSTSNETEYYVDRLADDHYSIWFRVGGYHPVRYGTYEISISAKTASGKMYQVMSSTGNTLTFDQTAYENVKDQGYHYYNPYFNAVSSTQDGQFGGYYNPRNCF